MFSSRPYSVVRCGVAAAVFALALAGCATGKVNTSDKTTPITLDISVQTQNGTLIPAIRSVSRPGGTVNTSTSGAAVQTGDKLLFTAQAESPSGVQDVTLTVTGAASTLNSPKSPSSQAEAFSQWVSVATVNSIAAGGLISATATAKDFNGNTVGSTTVFVLVPTVTLTPSSLGIKNGETGTLTVTSNSPTAMTASVTSSNPAVATAPSTVEISATSQTLASLAGGLISSLPSFRVSSQSVGSTTVSLKTPDGALIGSSAISVTRITTGTISITSCTQTGPGQVDHDSTVFPMACSGSGFNGGTALTITAAGLSFSPVITGRTMGQLSFNFRKTTRGFDGGFPVGTMLGTASVKNLDGGASSCKDCFPFPQ